jgi:RHS repeat-associated protein
MATQHLAPDTTVVLSGGFVNGIKSIFARGEKLFELSNHLQNVLVTISDKKIGVDANSDGQVDYYNADVTSVQDYYPFGFKMPGRQWSNGSYRYGFNGKEKDTESPVQYDYGFRIYDPRLVRFKSVDPLTNGYPELTPYQFASNRPIDGIDLDGLEYYTVHVRVRKENDGTNYVKITNVEDNTQMSDLQFANIHKRQFDPKRESKKYGNQGEGVLFIYYDMEGNKLGEGMMSSQSGLNDKIGRHGIWSGEGAPTDYGEGPQKNWEWDYSANPYVGMVFSKLKGIIQPIDEVDNIAFIHDEDQNRPIAPSGGHNNPINLESDIAFVANLMLYQERVKDKNYKDEFTSNTQSREARRAAKRGLKYFMGNFNWFERRIAGKKYREGEIPPKLKGMTKEQLKNKIEEVKNKIKQSGRKYGNANDVQL